MKSAFLLATAALVTGNAAAAVDVALNSTAAEPTTRQLESYIAAGKFRLVGADIVGHDIRNPRRPSPYSCFSLCMFIADNDMYQPCTAATWTPQDGGTCYMKDVNWKGPSTTPKAEAESFFVMSNAPDISFIWSATKDGFDMAGNDIDNKRGNSMGRCMDLCNANSKCYAVTWTNYNGGTCWLKSRASGYVAKAGAKVAYVARRFDDV